ncbi:hypothetical protein [Caballeronia sp. SL2Y3]|uniref:hypothetical protein n=1 Tax=Caballeronia sp. SL2Y3 TaxID=2878151 RepID=UPI001FD38BBD|nr:hypothetical protein [Caballeronia sp. SL2Y3]
MTTETQDGQRRPAPAFETLRGKTATAGQPVYFFNALPGIRIVGKRLRSANHTGENFGFDFWQLRKRLVRDADLQNLGEECAALHTERARHRLMPLFH